jgi:UDP-N-acetylmuramate: L-alanyl-gamma-D-glutamyl-meso-diaminopimelate ligase
MHIHILGICGTFMGGVALLAKQQGHTVTGSDANVYPPMSEQLTQQGIRLFEGYEVKDLQKLQPDKIIIGNALKRGMPIVEYLLNENLPYTSGPAWLAENILLHRWVLAVSGTHGKTTTTSLLAWMLEVAGKKPSFLLGGVPENFGVSARLTDSPFFVIEADEYDSAFFDKRSKFIHYRPRTLIINNLEFDHADIFANLSEIQKQFQHLVRTIPSEGLIIAPSQTASIETVLEQGCWTKVIQFAGSAASDWQAKALVADHSRFEIYTEDKKQGEVAWNLIGQHNQHNALAALLAAQHAGVPIQEATKACASFKNVKRRLEIRGVINGITVYDDFAHHPTAISTTLQGLRHKVEKNRIIAVLEYTNMLYPLHFTRPI